MLGALHEQLLHGPAGFANGDVDELGHVVGDFGVDAGEEFVDEGVLQAGVVVALVDVLQQAFDGGKDVARDDVSYLVDLALVVPREVLFIFVATGLNLLQTHLQKVTVGPEKSRHQL